MPVYFWTPTILEPLSLTTMGLSEKTTDSAIGQFGTGLKYAISVLIREGQRISFNIAGEVTEVTAREESFRDEPFKRLYFGDTPLPFTLNLGRNWALWQAYRELESNTRDESGLTSTTEPLAGGTTICVEGDAFEEVYRNRSKYFLESTPIDKVAGVEIHTGTGCGVYYRGILAHEAEKPFRFTYNILNETKLTEDRTLASAFVLSTEIGYAYHNSTNESIIERILAQRCAEWDFARRLASDEFKRVLMTHRNNSQLPNAWLELIRDEKRASGIDFDEHTLSAGEQAMIERAFDILEPLSVPRDLKIKYVTELGNGIYGITNMGTGEIFIARVAFGLGDNLLAQVILEEYIHKTTGHQDETRGFQTYLIERLVGLANLVRTN